MDPKQFEQTVNAAVSLQGRPVEARECPDQFFGLIGELVGKPQFPMRAPAHDRSVQACILMILESPHVDEFIDDLGPAKGATGEMIRQHLMVSLGLPGLEDYGLVLVNAIQHQCSLGANTIVYRDRIFRAVWANGGEADFSRRIVSLFRPGDVLVNCCTKGNDFEIYSPLRNLVETALRTALPEYQSMRRMHPASWRDGNWRGKQWRI